MYCTYLYTEFTIQPSYRQAYCGAGSAVVTWGLGTAVSRAGVILPRERVVWGAQTDATQDCKGRKGALVAKERGTQPRLGSSGIF